MRKITIIFLGTILLFGLWSCSESVNKETKAVQNTDDLYEKYKSMVTEGEGCAACVDCAALALAISYDTKEEIAISKAKLVKYHEQNGNVPCPELMPELTKEIASVKESE